MNVDDERNPLWKVRKKRGDDQDDLGEESEEFLERFEDPTNSDILVEKQVKEKKHKR